MPSLSESLLRYYRESPLPHSPLHAALREGAGTALRIAGRLRGLALPERPFVAETLQMLSGEYEPEVCALIRAALRPGDVAIDVGANIGFLTRVMAEAVGPTGRVVGFEPNPLLFPLAVANNAHHPQVLMLPVALSDAPGTGDFHVARDSMATGSLHADYVRASAPPWDPVVDALRVQLARGADLLAAMDIPRFALLKVDVEGHEISVLRGLASAIRGAPPLVALVEAWLPAQRAAGHGDTALYGCLRDLDFAVQGQLSGRLVPLADEQSYREYANGLGDRTMLYCQRGRTASTLS
jgi:FkbM family methyltransferase